MLPDDSAYKNLIKLANKTKPINLRNFLKQSSISKKGRKTCDFHFFLAKSLQFLKKFNYMKYIMREGANNLQTCQLEQRKCEKL